MTKQELEILAMVECLLVWDGLAHTGTIIKQDVISDLYDQGKLSQSSYDCGCPFCEFLLSESFDCNKCLWPGQHCCSCDSPLRKWFDSKSKNKRKKYARKILNMLLSIPMD